MKYAEVLASLAPGETEWTAGVPGDWMQGRTVFGGLQAALAVRAMRGVLARALPLRSLQVTFVAPVPGGTVHLAPRVLREGGSATHVRCDLLHEGRVACLATGVFGAGRPSSIAVTPPRPQPGPGPDELPDMPYLPGLVPAFVQHLQMRWARGTPPFSGASEPETCILARLREPDVPPEDALLALADSIPTPALSMLRAPANASSLTWSLELLADPAGFDPTGWSLIDTRVRAGAEGYLSQTSLLWDAAGKPWSVSHQAVAIFG